MKNSFNYESFCLVLSFLFPVSISTSFAQNMAKPKLILQITVDQLRADLPSTVYDRL